MIPVVADSKDFFTPLIFVLQLLKNLHETTQTIPRRQRNFKNPISIFEKNSKCNSQNFQQLEPKTIFSSLSR